MVHDPKLVCSATHVLQAQAHAQIRQMVAQQTAVLSDEQVMDFACKLTSGTELHTQGTQACRDALAEVGEAP